VGFPFDFAAAAGLSIFWHQQTASLYLKTAISIYSIISANYSICLQSITSLTAHYQLLAAY